MANTKKIALITGASSGLGKDFAKTLLSDNMIVYAAARRVEMMDEIKALGAIPLKMDITDESDVVSTVNAIIEQQGRIDILVNNAGFGVYGSIEETTIDDARYQFEVNLFGLARLTQLVLPHMREKKSGKIINISSIGGKVYTPLGAWYYATKHALEGWSDCLRIEVKAFGIDVVIIEPGLIKTEFADVTLEPMLARSGHGPYADTAQKLSKRNKEAHASGQSSPPSVISNLLLKAVQAERPKTRYSGGKYARIALFLRKWLSDKMYDYLIQKM